MTLNRFRGPNGITQMIALLESASPDRRDALLRSLSLENPGLASLVRTKVLTVEKILAWEFHALSELLKALDASDRKTLIIVGNRYPAALKGNLAAAWRASFKEELPAAPHADQVRNIEVLELNLIHRIRELERLGQLRLADIDPARAA